MTTPEPYDSDDDDLSEIDTTPEQFDAMMAEGEPVELVDPPVRFSGNNFTYEPGFGYPRRRHDRRLHSELPVSRQQGRPSVLMPDYSNRWWYVERPLPWLPILVCATFIAIIGFAVVLGIWWF